MKQGYVIINNKIHKCLIAVSQEERSLGLMHVKWPPPIMAFPNFRPTINKFWMKNTPSPLDIVFCMDSKIIAIEHGQPNTLDMIGPDEFSDLVVEFPRGFTNINNININDSIKLLSK